jgi:hypothetical protein
MAMEFTRKKAGEKNFFTCPGGGNWNFNERLSRVKAPKETT